MKPFILSACIGLALVPVLLPTQSLPDKVPPKHTGVIWRKAGRMEQDISLKRFLRTSISRNNSSNPPAGIGTFVHFLKPDFTDDLPDPETSRQYIRLVPYRYLQFRSHLQELNGVFIRLFSLMYITAVLAAACSLYLNLKSKG